MTLLQDKTRNWHDDKTDTDAYLSYCIRVVQTFAATKVEISGLYDDRNLATDLISADSSCRIGVRIRGESALHYKSEFTLRAGRPSGAKSEWQKIMRDKAGNYMLYGFRDPNKAGWLVEWYLIDLDVVRAHEAACKAAGGRQFRVNTDGTSYFVYAYDAFPPELIIACKRDGVVSPIPAPKE